jgi:hypothetical protein
MMHHEVNHGAEFRFAPTHVNIMMEHTDETDTKHSNDPTLPSMQEDIVP